MWCAGEVHSILAAKNSEPVMYGDVRVTVVKESTEDLWVTRDIELSVVSNRSPALNFSSFTPFFHRPDMLWHSYRWLIRRLQCTSCPYDYRWRVFEHDVMMCVWSQRTFVFKPGSRKQKSEAVPLHCLARWRYSRETGRSDEICRLRGQRYVNVIHDTWRTNRCPLQVNPFSNLDFQG